MRKSLLLFVLGLGAWLAPAKAEFLSLAGPASANGPFDVTVNLTNVFDTHDPVLDAFVGYGFNVSFDLAILSFLGETPGPLFEDLSGIPGAEVAGVVGPPLFFLGPSDFTEPLTLATLHFGIVGSGAGTVSVAGDPSVDPNQGLLYLLGSDPLSASTAVSVSAVPEPGTMSLLGGVLLVVCTINGRTSFRLPRS